MTCCPAAGSAPPQVAGSLHFTVGSVAAGLGVVGTDGAGAGGVGAPEGGVLVPLPPEPEPQAVRSAVRSRTVAERRAGMKE
ncbi:hypothetical protein GCM10008956_30970 [Deinococcus arenae]|uniref:Uncharacterized protein n=1 Tax=Deinococcus arenae TaxID=1452751 RepID=A0A8H9L9Z4_9DEIO|nr:hypothetical protein GCM10008956_30970 [Deinococcus arenae]